MPKYILHTYTYEEANRFIENGNFKPELKTCLRKNNPGSEDYQYVSGQYYCIECTEEEATFIQLKFGIILEENA